MFHLDTSLLSESKTRSGVALENNILALEEDVAENAESDASVILDTAEASR